MSNQIRANKLENRFYCEEGCGKWTPLQETDSDGNENTLASWNCGCWIDKPSDKNCHKCSHNLTWGEKRLVVVVVIVQMKIILSLFVIITI